LIPETFHDYLAQLPTWEHHLFADLILLDEPDEILQLINLRPLTLADALFTPTTDDIHIGTPERLINIVHVQHTYSYFRIARFNRTSITYLFL
jgi:hypothetical protein